MDKESKAQSSDDVDGGPKVQPNQTEAQKKTQSRHNKDKENQAVHRDGVERSPSISSGLDVGAIDLSAAPSFVKGVEALEFCVNKALYLPQQNFSFGRRGQLGPLPDHDENLLTICDPAAQQLHWTTDPNNILVIRKIHDDDITGSFHALLDWLVNRELQVYIEEKTYEESLSKLKEMDLVDKVHKINPENTSHLEDVIDMIITMGGDGTLLYVTSLFPKSVPPILSFHMGSLGFLSPFDFSEHKSVIEQSLAGYASLCLRSRLKCCVCRSTDETCLPIKTSDNTGMRLVLNEIVIDRGKSSQACQLELYIEREHVTTVRADGLIISTPTGSTAYAAAAGAAMVHPSIPCILIAPICSYSLSFRPIMIPAGAEVLVGLNEHSSRPVSVSFDGKFSTQLRNGDLLCITTCRFPVPCISNENQVSDWFESLARCLHWNLRKEQKSFSQDKNVMRKPTWLYNKYKDTIRQDSDH